ncbi:unnamed protein product [Allacma fusca]|uniref:Uncharacterized protein n=1 Tax=Allacma fusca TaxID=39272 RepID=A0A8J2NQT0_9HEXA|nr:unnamed protein product [Allacma fusca]
MEPQVRKRCRGDGTNSDDKTGLLSATPESNYGNSSKNVMFPDSACAIFLGCLRDVRLLADWHGNGNAHPVSSERLAHRKDSSAKIYYGFYGVGDHYF